MRGDTDADCEGASGQTLFARKYMAFHLLAQALSEFLGAHTVGFGEDEREFFSPIAGDSVGGATHLFQQPREFLQHYIALGMTIRVIVHFEAVNIDHQHREGTTIAISTGDLLGQTFLQGTVIVQLRQSISTGKPSRPGVLEGLLNAQVEYRCWYRLGHEICRPSLHRFHGGLDTPVACNNDHRYLFKGLGDLPE